MVLVVWRGDLCCVGDLVVSQYRQQPRAKNSFEGWRNRVVVEVGVIRHASRVSPHAVISVEVKVEGTTSP
eukprot:scaffold26011_cov24-Cyclotella_meneghiniana.AAC.1